MEQASKTVPDSVYKAVGREIRFFSDLRQKLYNLADVSELSDKDIDFLLSESWNTRVSLSLVKMEAHEKIKNGEQVDRLWLKRVTYKYKAVKAFMNGLREEKGLRFISKSPELLEELRQRLIENDTPESESIRKIDGTINSAISFRNQELGIFMELVTKEIGNQRFQELRQQAKDKLRDESLIAPAN
jgi:hypothetical protein